MKTAWTSQAIAAFAFSLAGCAHGYQSASDLESAERGPRACEKSCDELDMRMSAFVLVGHDLSGCVCSPKASAAPAAPPAAAPPAAVPPAGPPPVPPALPPPPPGEPPVPAEPTSQVQPEDAAAAVAAGYVVIEYAKQARERAQGSNPPTRAY